MKMKTTAQPVIRKDQTISYCPDIVRYRYLHLSGHHSSGSMDSTSMCNGRSTMHLAISGICIRKK